MLPALSSFSTAWLNNIYSVCGHSKSGKVSYGLMIEWA
jgi:hypothetical protein